MRKTTRMSEVYAWLIELLKSVGFETDGWQSGRIQRSIMTTIAAGNADLSELVKFTVEFSFGPTSSGPPLTLFSLSRYRNRRVLARKTKGPMRLRNVGSSSHPMGVGEVIVSDGAGTEFRNTTGGTLPPGSVGAPSSLVLEFEAALAGAASSNIGRGAVRLMVTQFAGVSVSNDVNPVDQPWYTLIGLDEELDTALQRRNETKWALQSLELVKEGFEAVARANGAIKVDIDDTNPRGQGTLDVYAAGAAAQLGVAEMQAIQLAFSKRVFRTDATWQSPWLFGNSSLIQVKPPAMQTFSLPAGIVYYTGQLAAVKEAVRLALNDIVTLCPIGGYNYAPGPTNVITIGDLSHAIEEIEGVATVELGLVADYAVASRTLVIADTDPYYSLTFVAVTG